MLADARGVPFAGIGVIRLLASIEQKQSISAAARACGLSYVKAWNMMNRLEKQLGRTVLSRASGGSRGGGASLTPFGRRFLRQFESYQQRVESSANAGLKQFLKGLTALWLGASVALTSCARKEVVNTLNVAAAASLKPAMDEVIAAFQHQHPEWTVDVTYGSSGNFYAQLTSRAPFDIFLSADTLYPEQLVGAGVANRDELFRYAVGRIVLWTPRDAPTDVEEKGIHALFHPGVARIAIANPRHAPYGVAAEAALRSYGVYDPNRGKLVLGENVAQTAQFIESGAAQIGVIPLSLALSPAMAEQGVYWEIPPDRYPRMVQGGVILPWARNPDLARAFRDFVLGEHAGRILARYGFFMPEE